MPSRLALVAFVALLLALPGCASVRSLEPPEVRVTSLQMLDPQPGSFEQRFAVGLRLLNPNDRALAVNGLNFELDVNDRRLASGVTDRAFELPRLGEAETSVVVTTSLFDVLGQALEIAGRKDATMSYRLRGRLHLGSGFVRTIPFDHRGTLTP